MKSAWPTCRFHLTRSRIPGHSGSLGSVSGAIRFEPRCNGIVRHMPASPRPRPWLPLADSWAEQNVESLALQPFSILSLYRRLLALRRTYRALRIGQYETLICHDDVFGFARSSGQEKLIMLLNFSRERRTVSFESAAPTTVLLSTMRDRSGETVGSEFTLDPNEAVISAPPDP